MSFCLVEPSILNSNHLPTAACFGLAATVGENACVGQAACRAMTGKSANVIDGNSCHGANVCESFEGSSIGTSACIGINGEFQSTQNNLCWISKIADHESLTLFLSMQLNVM